MFCFFFPDISQVFLVLLIGFEFVLLKYSKICTILFLLAKFHSRNK